MAELPHALEAEQSLLGSLLIDRDSILSVAPIIGDDTFYDRRHRTLYAAIRRLYDRRVPADLTILIESLESRDELAAAGGVEYISELLSIVPTAVHAPHYADIIQNHALRRRVIEGGQSMVRVGFETSDGEDAIAEAAAIINAIAASKRTAAYFTGSDLQARAYDRLEQHNEVTIPYGILDLDQQIGGMRPGQLIVPAARPSAGKTAFAVQVAYRNLRAGRSVGFISLEMSEDEITDRLIAMDSGVNMFAFRSGEAVEENSWAAISRSVGRLGEWRIAVDAHCSGTVEDVMARARLLYAAQSIDVLIVDYLQLMTVKKSREGRVQEVSTISRSLKQIARELAIPVIAPAQLSRAIEHRNPPIPHLSDLRESGSIEMDADLVIFIHHPYQYDKEAKANVAQLMIAKHRNGPTGVVPVKWKPDTAQFQPVEMHLREVA